MLEKHVAPPLKSTMLTTTATNACERQAATKPPAALHFSVLTQPSHLKPLCVLLQLQMPCPLLEAPRHLAACPSVPETSS